MPYGRDASKEVPFTTVITCHIPQAPEDSDTKNLRLLNGCYGLRFEYELYHYVLPAVLFAALLIHHFHLRFSPHFCSSFAASHYCTGYSALYISASMLPVLGRTQNEFT